MAETIMLSSSFPNVFLVHQMHREPPITTHGKLLRKGESGQLIAALPNGKEVVAFPARDLAGRRDAFTPGTTVVLELTPYDFSKARIAALVDAPDGRST